MKIITVVFLLYCVISCQSSPFFLSRTWFKGDVGFQNLSSICGNDSKVCTVESLISNEFWLHKIPISWMMDPYLNCAGYSTNLSYAMGTCIDTFSINQTMQCTCDMKMPACCVHK
jgi:hypothetical protein